LVRSQRNRCVLPGNARGANDDLRRRCAYAICKTSRAHWRISIGARILRCAHSRMALATMSRIASSRRRSRSCLLSDWKRSNNAQRVACLPAAPVFLFRVWGSSKPASTSPAAVRNELFEALRFEPADSQCSVLDRSSPVPPGSIASPRSTFGGGEGWIKRSQDSAISSQVRFSDSLRVKCAIRSHSAAFARYSSFLFMGVFRQWLFFVNRQTCRLFQLQRYFGHRGVGRAELEKAGVRRLAAVGNNLRAASSRAYFFIRLFRRPWADCGCWVCCATRGIARAACGARLSRSVA